MLQIAIGWLTTNCDKTLLQIATAGLLQAAISLLQIGIGITIYYKIITNSDRTGRCVFLRIWQFGLLITSYEFENFPKDVSWTGKSV